MVSPEQGGLHGLRAVITGASRGIGAEIARRLAHRSSWIGLVGRDREALEAVRSTLGTTHCCLISGDLLDPGTQGQILAAASAQGGLDLLVNNAGVSDFSGFSDQDPAVIGRLVQINLVSPMLLARALLPELLKSESAQIVNIGSTLAYIGHPGYAAYCAAKFGLRGFSEALAREFSGSNIRVRLFSPRATATGINTAAVRAMNRELGVSEDQPSDVAEQFVKFLERGDAEYCVGWPEKLFARLNQCMPGLVGGALEKKLPRMRNAWQLEDTVKEKLS
ncbi:MAG: SDR family oxidoreductase [Betaproteobacteria bacterium]|jgi:short-subunit dehydrogenase